jgi:hypothetical protein
MAQIFHPSSNTIAKATLAGGLFTLILLVFAAAAYDRSPYVTQVGVPKPQPVPFSHEHHVTGLGIHCLYCHSSVEKSSFAGIPSTHVCMTCHSQIWNSAEILQPVRDSWNTNTPLQWNRVHNIGDFAYFDHSIHVNKGVGCSSCHGRVDQMPLTWKSHTLHMEWCLNCHRHPEDSVRPTSEIFNMEYKAPLNQKELGQDLLKVHGINRPLLTNCSTCHR